MSKADEAHQRHIWKTRCPQLLARAEAAEKERDEHLRDLASEEEAYCRQHDMTDHTERAEEWVYTEEPARPFCLNPSHDDLQARLSTLEEALRQLLDAMSVEFDYGPTQYVTVQISHPDLDAARAALTVKIPTDPNTRAWLGIKPQFPEDETP